MQRKNVTCYFYDYFQTRGQVHHRQTRQASQLNLIQVKSNYGANTLQFKGVKIFNGLPPELTQIDTLSRFKKHLKLYFLKSFIF